VTKHLVPWQLQRACHLTRTEGLTGLAAGVARSVHHCRRRILCTEKFVIYATDTSAYKTGLALPPIDGLEVHILQNETDVERLVQGNYEDVRNVVRPAGRRLRQGAVGFCAFVRREVAHVAWVALSATAKQSFDVLPYPVDFQGGEACWGGALTTRRFRNRGIYRYVMAWRLRYCHEQGYPVLVDATAVDNVASLKSQGTYDPAVRSVGYYRRILWTSNWTEQFLGGA